MADKNVIFFDLFFTLITPTYRDEKNEYDIIHMAKAEWELLAENYELYFKRATGKIESPLQIIEEIIKKGGLEVSEDQKINILQLRAERMKKALFCVDETVLYVLSRLKKQDRKLCLISNADIIDSAHWNKSPLYDFFDGAIFSCDVGFVKPQREIYDIALNKMDTSPELCFFIGDGGSDEIKAAKQYGMTTILSEHLLKRPQEQLVVLQEYADYCVEDFTEILKIVNSVYTPV